MSHHHGTKNGVDEDKIEPDEVLVKPLQERLLEVMQQENLVEEEVRPACDDLGFVRRCLMAGRNDKAKAFNIGASSLRWRSKYRPSTITLKDFPTALSQEIYTVGCHTKDGSPALFVISKKWNPWKYDTDEYLRMMAFVMETCERAMDRSKPFLKVYLIHDFKNMSPLNGDLRKIRQLAKICSEYYPNRVVGVALNADFFTMAMWRFLSPLLDKGTRDRVSIFRPGTFDEYLEELVGMEKIPPSLGGKMPEEYPLLSEESVARFISSVHNS